MADKMIRIAGRGVDGTAKAVNTTNDGYILTQLVQGEGNWTTLLENHNTVGNAPSLNVSRFNSVALKIEGNYKGEITFLTGPGLYRNILAKDLLTGGTVQRTNKTGYFLIDVAGLDYLYLRLDKIETGSVTLKAKPLYHTTDIQPITNTQKLQEIARVLNVEVAAGETKNVIEPFRNDSFPFFTVGSYTDKGHNHDVKVQFMNNTPVTFSQWTGSPITVSSGHSVRNLTSFIETGAAYTTIVITNHDSENRFYDVFVTGVR